MVFKLLRTDILWGFLACIANQVRGKLKFWQNFNVSFISGGNSG
jgi:hypothetical protein